MRVFRCKREWGERVGASSCTRRIYCFLFCKQRAVDNMPNVKIVFKRIFIGGDMLLQFVLSHSLGFVRNTYLNIVYFIIYGNVLSQ